MTGRKSRRTTETADVVDQSMKEDDDSNFQSDDSNERATCPLFMEGLPPDFETNPGLSAIASLLNDDQQDEEHEDPKKKSEEAISLDNKPIPRPGGGKAQRKSTRRKDRPSKPYERTSHSSGPTRKDSSTMGEAQLFLKMWKL
jgi:hypothetical protein